MANISDAEIQRRLFVIRNFQDAVHCTVGATPETLKIELRENEPTMRALVEQRYRTTEYEITVKEPSDIDNLITGLTLGTFCRKAKVIITQVPEEGAPPQRKKTFVFGTASSTITVYSGGDKALDWMLTPR